MSDALPQLPEGWAWCGLQDIAEVRLGRQRSPKNHQGDNMVPYVRAANITWDGLDLSDVKEMNFTLDEVETYALREGDIVLSEASGSASEVGKPAIWRDEIETCCFQNTLIRVRSRGPLPEYLLLVLREAALSGAFVGTALGVGIHHLGASRLATWRIPLPPFEEQRRIVAAAEQRLSALEHGLADLEDALHLAEAMRTSVLNRAVSGDWPHVPLKDIIVSLKNGIFASRPAEAPPGTAIFRISAVRPLMLDHDDVRYAPLADPADGSGYFVEEGDLLFTRYSGNSDYVGACARVRSLPRPTLHPDKLIRVVIDRSKALPAFVEIACSAGSTLEEIRSRRKTTAGQVGIAGGQLKTVLVPLPSLEEQEAIVAETEAELAEVERLREVILSAQAAVGDLRRSLLNTAVCGDLVPQSEFDEPAAVQLETIRVTRADRAGAAKRRKKRHEPANVS